MRGNELNNDHPHGDQKEMWAEDEKLIIGALLKFHGVKIGLSVL